MRWVKQPAESEKKNEVEYNVETRTSATSWREVKECNAIIVEIHFFILPPAPTRSRALLFAAIADTWNWINLINTSWLQDDNGDVDDEAEALHAAAVDCVGVDTSHSKSISSLLVMRSFSVPLSHCRVSFLHWKLKLDSGELSELNWMSNVEL